MYDSCIYHTAAMPIIFLSAFTTVKNSMYSRTERCSKKIILRVMEITTNKSGEVVRSYSMCKFGIYLIIYQKNTRNSGCNVRLNSQKLVGFIPKV